ncbi:MAG: hypothetical protein OXI15_07755 [Chromatiales bacterium]|nr:hypothetical protein [Chromatiales bacterium]
MLLADVVEIHDRIVDRTHCEAARACEAQLGDETAAVLQAFAELGTALIGGVVAGGSIPSVSRCKFEDCSEPSPSWRTASTAWTSWTPRTPRRRLAHELSTIAAGIKQSRGATDSTE